MLRGDAVLWLCWRDTPVIGLPFEKRRRVTRRSGQVFWTFGISEIVLFFDGRKEIKFVHQMDDPSASFNALIQLEMQLRGVFDDHPAGEQVLELSAHAFELSNDMLGLFSASDHRHVDVSVFEIRCDVDLLNSDELGVENHFPPQKVA
jgi:hypothetical protein